MADKPLTQAQIISALAEQTGLDKSAVAQFLEAQRDIAYEQAEHGFTIPGIGKFILVQRKARMGRNPATGESIRIPAKQVLKFRVFKSAVDAVVPTTDDTGPFEQQ